MMKSLLAANRSEKDSFRIPHSVQQSIPIRRIYTDGIWQVGQKYSKTWRFSDINYAASSLDDRRSIFRSYGAVLNSLPTDATAKITIINRRLNPVDFQRTMLMPECSDGLDYYRGEYNQIILDKAAESNNLVQEKYITLSIGLRKIEQTRAYFRRVDTNLSASFGRLDSGAYTISCADRLRLLHDFFRPGEEASFRFDLSANIKRGIDFRDLICPDGLQFRAGYFEMGGKFGRVLFMRDYASFISDEMIKDLSDFSRNLLLSIDILPIPTEEAVREVQSRILGVETDITRWQQRQNRQNNFTATVPYDLEQMRTESKDLLEDLTARDQRLMFACVTLVHIADSLEQLDADTQTLQSIAQEKLCGFSVLRYQQEDGLNTVLPYGLRRIHALRTLTTESCAVLMPFRAQEIQDPGGLYYGVNAISKNLLICDRKRLISPHAFYLGVSGSGKSVAMKNTIANVALSTNDDIIIIDAEREYAPIARALGGEVIEISPNSQHHINPLDLQDGYEDGENPIAMKSELITSILEQQMGAGLLTGSQKSIYNRDTDARNNLYRTFLYASSDFSWGVQLVFDNKVILGTRARKTRTKSFNAFSSIDYPETAVFRDTRLVTFLRRPTDQPPVRFYERLEPAVFVLRLVPGMRADIIPLLAPHYRALVVESFGVGGLPEYEGDASYFDIIHRGIARGKLVVMTTQVPNEGSNLAVYHVGGRLKSALRLLEAYDMTTEAAVAKLMWIMGQTRDFDEAERLFYRPVARDILYEN